MVILGPVQYARNRSVRLAFRVLGEPDAPPLVLVPGWISNVDDYDDPTSLYAVMAEALAVSTRFIVWDKRGTGLSDPVESPPALDERMDDLRAVMDAAGVDQASLMGGSEGGPMSVQFAATYPERVRSLVLFGTSPRFSCDPPSFPWGFIRSEIDVQMTEIDERWGEAFSPQPGRCYRMVYSAQLQADHCRRPRAWKGIWRDRTGRNWYVEACREHAPKVSSGAAEGY